MRAVAPPLLHVSCRRRGPSPAARQAIPTCAARPARVCLAYSSRRHPPFAKVRGVRDGPMGSRVRGRRVNG
uniref:Uncharacterized protein n=1 Tax=Arundo donax TaxID=35708 RepID=A0A0A8ZLU6_ARUDO